jgi:hypothetical protein
MGNVAVGRVTAWNTQTRRLPFLFCRDTLASGCSRYLDLHGFMGAASGAPTSGDDPVTDNAGALLAAP